MLKMLEYFLGAHFFWYLCQSNGTKTRLNMALYMEFLWSLMFAWALHKNTRILGKKEGASKNFSRTGNIMGYNTLILIAALAELLVLSKAMSNQLSLPYSLHFSHLAVVLSKEQLFLFKWFLYICVKLVTIKEKSLYSQEKRWTNVCMVMADIVTKVILDFN